MGWKHVQSKLKKSKRNKLALGVLALVVGFLIISWTIRLTQSLFSPWGLQDSYRKSYTWNGEFNINLLIRTDHISLFSYNPKQAKIIIVNIPDETFLEVPGGFGLWQLRSVYGLGGDNLLKETLTSFLAIPIDGFLDFSSLWPRKSAIQIIDTLRGNPFSGFNLLSSLKTNLTVWELLRLKLGISAVRFDKVEERNLDKLNILDQGNLADGTPIFTADPVRLDSVLSDLADPKITSEHKSITVLNATDHPQLASKWTRLITNLGGNVIITGNAKQRLKKTQVAGEDSATLRRLRQIFDYDKINPSSEDLASSRAQINLLLGEDYLNR